MHVVWPWSHFSIRMASYRNGKSHCGYKTVERPSCGTYTSQMTSLWNWLRCQSWALRRIDMPNKGRWGRHPGDRVPRAEVVSLEDPEVLYQGTALRVFAIITCETPMRNVDCLTWLYHEIIGIMFPGQGVAPCTQRPLAYILKVIKWYSICWKPESKCT